MDRFSLFRNYAPLLMCLILTALTGCSLDASIQDLTAVEQIAKPEVRHDHDFSNTEVATSGNYEIHGQVAETAEKQSSGNFVIEGTIAYE